VNVYQPFIILSAEKSERTTEENQQRTEGLEADLKQMKYHYEQVRGAYEGVEEISFVVYLDTDRVAEESNLLWVASQYGQESILHVDANRCVCLMTVDNPAIAYLGKWKSISEERAKECGAWTFLGGAHWTSIK